MDNVVCTNNVIFNDEAFRIPNLLMHAMGPNVAGVIGTAVCAGYMISRLS